MESGMLRTLQKCHPWLDAKTVKSWTQFLCEELPKYMMYISVLRTTVKSLDSINSLGLDTQLGGAAAASWTAFRKHVQDCCKFATPDEMAKPKACGAKACTEPGTQLCSRCFQTSYCSRTCQIASWGLHKTTCKAREKARAMGTVPDLSLEDIAFACRIALHNFEQRRAQMRGAREEAAEGAHPDRTRLHGVPAGAGGRLVPRGSLPAGDVGKAARHHVPRGSPEGKEQGGAPYILFARATGG
ncbi:hypothetical protein FB451DRAFT_68165 [Mycena latifolia]|nr:hypothetical protein FB451DRAFT_68165 [Mycena latifolia]